MKIINLQAENVKRLTAVHITPLGNIVEITGENGNGKTSVLDSILWALGGEKAIQSVPIHEGKKSARIKIALGDKDKTELEVERRITEKSSYLYVRTPDGAEYKSPQRICDQMLGSLTFDPLDFMRSKPSEQFDTLKGLVELSVDLDEHAKADDQDFKERTQVNRDIKAKRAQADAIEVEDGLPDARLDEVAISQQIADASDINSTIERKAGNRRRMADQAARLVEDAAAKKTEADSLAKRVEKLRAEAADLEGEAKEIEDTLANAPPLPEKIIVTDLMAALQAARAINAKIAKREQRDALLKEVSDLQAQADALTNAMEDRKAERAIAMSEAKMPIAGLGFGDGIVTMNGLPLDQASDAQQLLISTAIAAALNPKLRVIRIRDGSLLDKKSWATLSKFAEEKDLQVWIETVASDREGAVVIVDGHVEGQAATAEAAE